MNINASIVDQRVAGIVATNPEWFPGADENKHKSAAFVLLCMSTVLDLSLEECFELLTDGGNDAGVDGLHLGDVEGGEFFVTIFQGKYKIKDLSGTANFPENDVQKTLSTVRILFDPRRQVALNEKIAPKIDEVRSLIRDGYIPTVRAVLCNNGEQWTSQVGKRIQEEERQYNGQLELRHFNHDAIVQSLKGTDRIDGDLNLSGKVIVEDMNYMRVLVGRVAVNEIRRLFDEHGDHLLQRNIRRFLGPTNRVNADIRNTLLRSDKSDKFYFLNNGITVVCDRFDYNAFQSADYQVQLRNMQVINGGQTCRTIQKTLDEGGFFAGADAYVMVRIYQLPEDSDDVIQEITKATNSQNPVDLRDLRSNDEVQKTLTLGLEQLGITYKRQREASVGGTDVVASSTVAEAVLAVWREMPHQAKFRRQDHFDKLYDTIFENLNASQALLATLIFRMVESKRKAVSSDPPPWLHYASHHLAMLIGREILGNLELALKEVSHKNFAAAKQTLDERCDVYYAGALDTIDAALRSCYGPREISLQQLAGTFRRGDLMEMLDNSGDVT